MIGVAKDSLFENLAETIPPTTELLGRLKDVSSELFKLAPEFIQSRMVCDFRVSVRGSHLDQRWLVCPHPESFVSR